MLASLTTTAVTRGWPPAVYSRLVSQLRDSTDLGGSSAVLDTIKSLISESTSTPLLFEYICTVSNDPHSLISLPVLLNWLAGDWKSRSQPIKDLVAYLGRFAAKEWKLPHEYTDSQEVAQHCGVIITQADQGCLESKVLVDGLAQAIIPQLFISIPEWRSEVEPALNRIGITINTEAQKVSQRDTETNTPNTRNTNTRNTKGSSDERADDENTIANSHSSRALRLLWLDWMLRTAQCFDFDSFRRQLDLVWPGDRETVISYELCITSFDVLASPRPESCPKLVRPFITRALPLLLQKLNAGKSIDSVIARVFTTLDKAIVETIEQRYPGTRAEFGGACVDIGLCDPTVMHSLHRSHTPRPAYEPSQLPQIADIISNPSLFTDLHPKNQYDVAQNIIESVCGSTVPIGRHELALLCGQIHRNQLFTDTLFVHISVREFLAAVCEYANVASTQPDEDGGAGLIFSDLGLLLSTVKLISLRYQNIELPSGWATSYITRKKFSDATKLSHEESSLMGMWIVGLFSGSGSGIADELLRPFNELGEILPVLLHQAVRAYRSAVIDRETLKSGLDYFVHPFSVTLFAPLVVVVLKMDLFEGMHQSTTLECLIFFLTMLLQKKSPEFDIGKAAVLRLCRELVSDIAAVGSCMSGTTVTNQSTKKLMDAFNLLVDELAEQIGPDFCIPPTQPYGLGETSSLVETVKLSTSSLMNWQLKLQGAPTIPSCYKQAKSALGIKATLSLIEQVTIPQSKDTLLAILVTDGLWSKESKLLDAEELHLSQVAQGILKEFSNIFQSLPKHREIVIAGATRPEDTEMPQETIQEQDAHGDGEPTGAVSDSGADQGLSMNHSSNAPNAGPLGSFDGFDTGLDTLSQPLPTEPNDFENDFASQPMMNLADLDSAMDFAWE